jgi:uncharacterized protein (DUF488 family)
MNEELPAIFTIGHSTHSYEAFLALLRQHGVTAVADVRSQPYSRRMKQFQRETLAARLNQAGIDYIFLGDALGARRTEAECYQGPRVDYRRIANLPLFRAGLDCLRQAAAGHRVALMCAEKEPLDCHRTILVARELRGEWRILHILANGSLEDHHLTEQRLLRLTGVSRTIFDPTTTNEQRIQKAYDQRGEQIAYRRGDDPVRP